MSERKRRGLGFTSTIGSATFTPSFRFALPGEIDEVDVDPDKASDKVDVTLTSTLGGVSIACLPNTTRKLPILIRADLRPTRDEFRSPPSARASRLETRNDGDDIEADERILDAKRAPPQGRELPIALRILAGH